MPRERKMTADLVAWQARGFRPFTETVEVFIKAGMDKGDFPADQDLIAGATQIIGLKAQVNNNIDDAVSFLSGTKLLKKTDVESAGLILFENNSEKLYRNPLSSFMKVEDDYTKVWAQGYSSKESKIVLGKPVTEDRVVLIEIIYA